MARIVVTRPVMEEGLRPLFENGHQVEILDPDPEHPLDEDALIEAAREADALITMPSDPVTARVLENCPKLRIVAQHAVGYENIDLEAARVRGIVVTHTPGVLTDATADFTFALLLALVRRVREADRYVREGHFKRWETKLLLGHDLRDKVLGIVGLGRIGSAVARRALGFGMRVVYYNRRPANPTVERQSCARYVSFDELLRTSDVISIHCPLNKESYHLFDRAAFAKMKPTAVLVNTARGPIVDEEALVEALEQGQIAGAALDVFEHEPRVHPGLIRNDRVVLAPHLGSATVEARTAMARACAEAVLAVLNGEEKIPYRLV
ncbi:Glyoxylate reductase [Rhodothermus marinus SG0.5JP17-172]|uniref:2-hydroxyacid dehydrogenase n=1 Tax=Rhodothermus marinus TaxID=29549 RepID=UPI000223DB7E|nr:D-glycerate dehydrogenase [Rhodothermus marinus]AEN74052.1 Glyoxylate reductase [Rhodothermus marinus SG0.5JP17-172]